MPEPLPLRVAYSPAEFAKLFGKSQTWGYRQIYAGHVNAITQHGRILIPSKEVEKILKSAGIYNGIEKPSKSAKTTVKRTQEQETIWQRFLVMRRQPESFPKGKRTVEHIPTHLNATPKSFLAGRIAAAWQKKDGRDNSPS